MHTLLGLLSDPDTQLNTRIGISAIMEEFAGSEQLQDMVDQLGELTKHSEASIRGDACHFLALSGDNRAVNFIESLLEDPDASVREIAGDSLEQLSGSG